MKKSFRNIIALTLCAFVILIVGCGQQELPSVKKSRLIAVENMQLTKELERRDKQIESIIELHNREIKKQEKLLTECVGEKENWKQKALQNVKNQMEGVFDTVIEQNAKLRRENKKLKAQIEQLKIELEEQEKSKEDEESVIREYFEEP